MPTSRRTRAWAPLVIASVSGSDVLDEFDSFDETTFAGEPVETYTETGISANAYMGVEPIIGALDAGADVIVTNRVSDVSLFLTPMMHEFGWTLPESGTSDRSARGSSPPTSPSAPDTSPAGILRIPERRTSTN